MGYEMMDDKKTDKILAVQEAIKKSAKETIQTTIDSLDIHLQPEQIYAFQAIDKDVFYNYIDAIKTVLKYEAKEWHVVEQLVTHPNHSIYYHVARHDFSAGAEHQPIEGLTQCVFAFIQQTEGANDLHLILNHPPFTIRSVD